MGYTLEFDRPTHTYYVDGRQVRGVSRVLEVSGLKPPFFRRHDDSALVLGSAVHQLTELLDLGTADQFDFHPKVLAFKEGWLNLRRLKPFDIEQIEVPLYSPTLDFAGTPDRVVRWGGPRGPRVLLEIKTGQRYDWHPFQTAAYQLLAGTRRRFVVYLDPGYPLGFKMEEHVGRTDEQKFRAALITTQGMVLGESRTA